MKGSAIITSVLAVFSMNVFADSGDCYNRTFPAPEFKMPVFGQSNEEQKQEAGDGYYTPMSIPALKMTMFGVELGRPYSAEEFKKVISSLQADYSINGPIETGLTNQKGHRYTPFYARSKMSGLSLDGFHDEKDQNIIITNLSQTIYGQQINWQDLKSIMVEKFGEGIVAAGSNQANYAARFKDGSGGWYEGIAKACERRDDCEGYVSFNYRNNYKKNSGAGICFTDTYKFNMSKVDVFRQINKYERNAAEESARNAADSMQLSKPKF